jgi:ribonuclease Y
MEILLTAAIAAAVAAAAVLVAVRVQGSNAGDPSTGSGGGRSPAEPGQPASADGPVAASREVGSDRYDGGARGNGAGADGVSRDEGAAVGGGALRDEENGAKAARAARPPAAPAAAATDAAAPSSRERAGGGRDDPDELRARREELARLEERLRAEEKSLELRAGEADRRETSLGDRARNLESEAGRLKASKREQLRELERVAGLSAGQAKQVMMRELEDELRHESARLIRRVEEETRREADRRARSILSTCMQRVAGSHAADTTVSTVQLESDELKGRIIGREGRNIRALETLTGIDFIIDDTPGAVLLSGFDGVRREVARLTLESLLQDGRIHPARIEEAFATATGQLDERIVELGEQTAFEAGAGALHPELVKLLGRLHFRTSYGQNVRGHSIECARLAGLLAGELGASPKIAARAALLHDIGKAVTHEIEGPHALVGGELARRHNEQEAVAHAMEAHHDEVAPQTIEAVVVQIADAASGARPGARGQSLERYVNRLHDLEGLAARHAGVEKVYAMHAGREVRVIVSPEDVDDDAATLLSRTIAREVEQQLEYPGQVKITVIRERRSTDYAR